MDDIVSFLGLPDTVLSRARRVESRGGNGFSCFGGGDAFDVVRVFVGARCADCPVPAERVLEAARLLPGRGVADCFDESKVRGLGGELAAVNGLADGFDVSVECFVGFYSEVLDFPASQSCVADVLCVSESGLRGFYKEAVSVVATGVETGFCEVGEVEVTAESFGYTGEKSVEVFACFLAGRCREEGLLTGCSKRVVAAAVLYVAGKVI